MVVLWQELIDYFKLQAVISVFKHASHDHILGSEGLSHPARRPISLMSGEKYMINQCMKLSLIYSTKYCICTVWLVTRECIRQVS